MLLLMFQFIRSLLDRAHAHVPLQTHTIGRGSTHTVDVDLNDMPVTWQGSLRVCRFNPFEGWVGSDSVGEDILISGRIDMNRALDGAWV